MSADERNLDSSPFAKCSYYRDLAEHVVDGDRAFLEEYRAYLAECWFVKDTSAGIESCAAYASSKLEICDFDHDLRPILPQGSRPEPEALTQLVAMSTETGAAPLGRLVPEREAWPRSFAVCAEEP